MTSHYSTHLSIPIVAIQADTAEQAEAILNEFIDRIAPIMDDVITWHEADWIITEVTDAQADEGTQHDFGDR